ncbi:MAG: energy transducer TonB [Acidobacteria bacterium]|nr:energy transducer TonB [Acidobacteriota bacterium]
MLKQISSLFLIFIFSLCAYAQTEKYNAPIKWERYKVSDKDVSVLFPKLPILIQRTNICSEEETNQYAAYASEIVYGMTIVSRTSQKVPDYCNPKKKFDEGNFDSRLKEIRALFADFDETKFTQNAFEVIKLDSKTTSQVYWLINDFKNKRWFEFWITGTDKDKVEIKNFVESININKNAQGVEIGKGSSRTLGDEGVTDTTIVATQEKNGNETERKEEVQNIRIVLKPFAKYTDASRQASLQGTVRLRITFLASGGIGTVSPLTTLPYGLTEQAIAAAMKIVFIPAKRNGKTFSTVKIVDYSFSLY